MFLLSPNILYTSGGGGGGFVSLTNQAVTQSGVGGTQYAGYKLTTGGIVQARNKSVYTTRETWLLSGSVSDYVAYATYTGAVPTGTFSTELPLSGSPEWYITGVVNEVIVSTLTIQIRNAATHAVLDTCTVDLTSEVSPYGG